MRAARKAFTLIEVMIVIAVIAIIAGIAIPSMIKSRMAASESAAAATLKTFNGMMAMFRQKGYGGSGNRYPFAAGTQPNAGKYCGLHFEVNNAGSAIRLISVADAKGDAGAWPGTDPQPGNIVTYVPVINVTTPVLQPAITFSLYPKQGYWFGLCKANEAGFTYDHETSLNRYALMAAPQEYGRHGENTFIMNQEGTIYNKDRGTSGWIDFPGPHPTEKGWVSNE